MSKTTTTQDELVEQFDRVFELRDATDTYPYSDDIDGQAWVGFDGVVMLCTDEVTQFGNHDLSQYSDSEYARTEVIGSESYGFHSDNTIHWIDASILRDIANKIFDVSYKEIRSWAQTADLYGDEMNCPVKFIIPNSDYFFVIAPKVGNQTENNSPPFFL